MPAVRRSNRIQTKKPRGKKEPASSSKSPIRNKQLKPQIGKEGENKSKSQVCYACKQKHPPIRRYNVLEWVQCDNCDAWWHAECACMTAEDIIKLTFYEISFTCALCVLKGSPWIVENHNLLSNLQENKEPNKNKEIKQSQGKADINSNSITETKPISESCEESQEDSVQSKVIIIDNIQDAKAFRAASEIKKKVESNKIEGVQFGYNLAKGGIALQFKDNKSAEKARREWPSSPVFSEQEIVHSPSGLSNIKTGFIKNINPTLEESAIKERLLKDGFPILSVKSCYHRNSGLRMPVVKVLHQSNADLKSSLTKPVPFSFRGKAAYIEPERKNRVIRCFNCMRYGHISLNCTFESKCENCGLSDQDHTVENCTGHTKCANCGEEHRASSRLCPVYQSKAKEIVKTLLLQ